LQPSLCVFVNGPLALGRIFLKVSRAALCS
jgi:hypothetical protein